MHPHALREYLADAMTLLSEAGGRGFLERRARLRGAFVLLDTVRASLGLKRPASTPLGFVHAVRNHLANAPGTRRVVAVHATVGGLAAVAEPGADWPEPLRSDVAKLEHLHGGDLAAIGKAAARELAAALAAQ